MEKDGIVCRVQDTGKAASNWLLDAELERQFATDHCIFATGEWFYWRHVGSRAMQKKFDLHSFCPFVGEDDEKTDRQVLSQVEGARHPSIIMHPRESLVDPHHRRLYLVKHGATVSQVGFYPLDGQGASSFTPIWTLPASWKCPVRLVSKSPGKILCIHQPDVADHLPQTFVEVDCNAHQNDCQPKTLLELKSALLGNDGDFDGASATPPNLNFLAVTPSRMVFFDFTRHNVREINWDTRMVSTLAGKCQVRRLPGITDGSATEATFDVVWDIMSDSFGNLLLHEMSHLGRLEIAHRLRRIDHRTRQVQTIYVDADNRFRYFRGFILDCQVQNRLWLIASHSSSTTAANNKPTVYEVVPPPDTLRFLSSIEDRQEWAQTHHLLDFVPVPALGTLIASFLFL